MGPFFWPVTCAHMGKQLNPQLSHPGKVGGKLPPPPLPGQRIGDRQRAYMGDYIPTLVISFQLKQVLSCG